MYFKIALKNVKKSFKDYSIYFLTLTLAVCIFYSFNSMEAQQALIEMKNSGKEFMKTLTTIISGVSVFVAIILGGLILYANNFLIKKRNKELGIYMILGMGKSRISKIVILETIIVGFVSLFSGLILGFAASQGLSVLVSKLFEVKMDKYSFVLSTAAVGKTIFYFGIMFLLVMIFNTYIISKYKIIDLLTVGRKTEEIKFKNPFIYLITFILCVCSLGGAYKLIVDIGLKVEDPRFIISIILGIVGTVLFFFSLTGFVLYVVKRSKGIYFKGLNIFTVKQINSKVNTNFISMSVICLMLFVTIGMLSTGFSFKSALESGLKESTPFDASAYIYVYEDDDMVKSIGESLDRLGVEFNSEDKVAYYNQYASKDFFKDVFKLDNSSDNIVTKVMYIKLSDYNKLREISNEKPISLKEDEVIITSNFSNAVTYMEDYMKNNNTINLCGKNYNIKDNKIVEHNLKTEMIKNNLCTIVVNDEVCNDLEVVSSVVNVNFANKEDERKFLDDIRKVMKIRTEGTSASIEETEAIKDLSLVFVNTRESIYEENRGATTTVLFVGIYLGIVFLVSSMAILALQQLSEASDSVDRYVSLKRLGVSRNSINKTIFTQTLIYFSLPVILALVHSIVGIQVANDFISLYDKPDIGGSALITAGILLGVYIVYFYTTYIGYKNIVKSRIK